MLTVACVLMNFVAASMAAATPPNIYRESSSTEYFITGGRVVIKCEATGEPQPEYSWKKNNIEFRPSDYGHRVVQNSGTGTLRISNLEDDDEGVFQCFASNSFGTSASKKVNLRKALLEESESNETEVTHTPKLGESLTLPCGPPESVPRASVSWVILLDEVERKTSDIIFNERVSMDKEHNLRITNIKKEDYHRGLPYTCKVTNNFIGRFLLGPLHYIEPLNTTEEKSPVQYLWSDQQEKVGLRGENFTLKCIFSGNPTPVISWARTDNRVLSSHPGIKSSGQELKIPNLQLEDAGSYQCSATNSASHAPQSRPFVVSVNSKPYFIDKPKDIEIGVGANAEFTCSADGVPEPDIAWSINGIALTDVTDKRIKGSRFKQSSKNQIVLENVELTDNMLVQCSASNIHGHVFADVSLNVVLKTTTTTTEKTTTIKTTTIKTTPKPVPVTPAPVHHRNNSGHTIFMKTGDWLVMTLISFLVLNAL